MPAVSVLALPPVAAGPGEALARRETVELARHADRPGFHRRRLGSHELVGEAFALQPREAAPLATAA